MQKKIKRALVAATVFLFGVLILYFVILHRVHPVWEAILPDLPDHVSLSESDIVGTYYIIKQTHEPLFRQDDGQRYTSKLLLRWSRNVTSTNYVFCPNTALRFDDRTQFSLQYFRDYIVGVTHKYYPDFTLNQQNNSFTITFPVQRKGYLNFLSQYKNAPSVKYSDKVEHGLGPFEVKNIRRDQIELSRKQFIVNGYNHIILHQYHGTNDPNLQNHNIADFNHLLSSVQPKWLRAEYLAFGNAELESGNLLINHTDPEVRKWLYNCIDVDKFRKAFLPISTGFLDIKTVLPIGVPGGEGGTVVQKCTVRNESPIFNGPIVLADQNVQNLSTLNKFAQDFMDKTGHQFTIKPYPIQTLEKELNTHNTKHPFQLLLCVLSTPLPDASIFFEHLCGPDSYYDSAPQTLRKQYQDLISEDDPDIKTRKAAELARSISAQHYLLPLYQFYRRLYYPKYIDNITVGRDFLEYPEVGDFRW